MASAMRKMAVYLGLMEDDHHYDEQYADDFVEAEDYPDYATDYVEHEDPRESPFGYAADPGAPDGRVAARPSVPEQRHSADLARITTLHPRTYNEARTIGEHFREGTPVIMNLTEMVDSDARRLVDFAAGLIFGLRGSIDRVTNKVFLLSPANVEVTAEDKARMAERGFFNQS